MDTRAAALTTNPDEPGWYWARWTDGRFLMAGEKAWQVVRVDGRLSWHTIGPDNPLRVFSTFAGPELDEPPSAFEWGEKISDLLETKHD